MANYSVLYFLDIIINNFREKYGYPPIKIYLPNILYKEIDIHFKTIFENYSKIISFKGIPIYHKRKFTEQNKIILITKDNTEKIIFIGMNDE